MFRDIYGRPEILATRMSWINKDFYDIIDNIRGSDIYCGNIIITDIYRTSTESLIARRKKGAMVAPPGLSGHNYGISIDIDIKGTAKGLHTPVHVMRSELDILGLKGIRSESWHFNLGVRTASDYYNQFYYNLHKDFKTYVYYNFITRFNEVCNLSCSRIIDAQRYLGLKPDNLFGRKTYLSSSMYMAEKMGMLDVNNKNEKELVIDFEKIWKA